MPQLFLDCDGVLADFDRYAERVFGLSPHDHEATVGAGRFWADLQKHPDFFYKLPVLQDGRALYEAVKHLRPVILTGRPSHAGGLWAVEQKQRWAAKHFPGVEIIVCLSRNKCHHMRAAGDVLVDDRAKYRPFWTDAGGVFVLHRNASTTLQELKTIGVL